MSENISSFQKFNNKLKNRNINLVKIAIIAAIVIVLAVAIKIFIPNFWTRNTIYNVLISVSTTGLLAIGISFVLVGGGLDISLPAAMTAAAVVGAKVMFNTQNTFLGIIVMLGVALAFGVINGLACSYFKMIPFIATMATMVLAEGIAAWVSESKSIYGLPESFINIFSSKIGGADGQGGFPMPVIYLIVFAAIGYLILNHSTFGRKIFVIGVNRKTAIVCGIKATGVQFLTYIIASVYTGIVAMILTARLESAAPSMAGSNMNMDVLAAAVLGGVSMNGGQGSALGALCGAIVISAFGTIMSLLGVEAFPSMTYKGLLILLITFLDTYRNKNK